MKFGEIYEVSLHGYDGGFSRVEMLGVDIDILSEWIYGHYPCSSYSYQSSKDIANQIRNEITSNNSVSIDTDTHKLWDSIHVRIRTFVTK